MISNKKLIDNRDSHKELHEKNRAVRMSEKNVYICIETEMTEIINRG